MEQFVRSKLLINEEKFNDVVSKKILLVGLGGVGGNALEALVRFGFVNITIIDRDVVDISNLNRQLLTNHSNIGESKVKIAKERALLINPNVKITALEMFLGIDNIDTIDTDFDYIIDACDTVTTKFLLIKFAKKNNIDSITCLGTGKRFDPSKLIITKIDKTSGDPLAKVLRKMCKDEGIKNVSCVTSTELPHKCEGTVIGSLPLVPNTAGIYCVSYIVNKEMSK